MKKQILLDQIQEYSNQAFLQGYAAKERNIDKNDKSTLGKMPEAFKRLDCARKIFNEVMNASIEM